jgi:hypothetical protein
VHKFFRRHPLGLDGQYLLMPEVREQGHRALWGNDPEIYVDPEPRIWAASEGDVCFWCGIVLNRSCKCTNCELFCSQCPLICSGTGRSSTAAQRTTGNHASRYSRVGLTPKCAWTENGFTSGKAQITSAAPFCRPTVRKGHTFATTCQRIRGTTGERPCERSVPQGFDYFIPPNQGTSRISTQILLSAYVLVCSSVAAARFAQVHKPWVVLRD